MCQLMGVSRSAYYDYVRRTDNYSEKQCHEEILETVRGIANSSNHSYGSRRIVKALNALGYPVGRWKARSLMREAGVQFKLENGYLATPVASRTDSTAGLTDRNMPVKNTGGF